MKQHVTTIYIVRIAIKNLWPVNQKNFPRVMLNILYYVFYNWVNFWNYHCVMAVHAGRHNVDIKYNDDEKEEDECLLPKKN